MRRFVLSAIACVAFAGSTFASSETEELNPCEITILIYSNDGELLEALVDLTFPEGGAPCFAHGSALVNQLRDEYPEAVFDVSIVG